VSTPETYDESVSPARAHVPRLESQIVVLMECDRPTAGGARFSLAGVHEIRIGRGSAREATRMTSHGYTTLHVHLPGRSLSSAHARLVRSHGQWMVEDVGSRNGTFVDGARVTRAALGPNDVLEVGRTLLALRENVDLGAMPSDLDTACLVGEPPGLRTLVPSLGERFAALKRLAPSKVPVLLLGETGTGKELLAGALHALAERRGALTAVNCGALSPTLSDAQLFGHTRGAFSGAARDELGFVRSADGGTLFLDEIGELPAAAQALLLRVLQESEVVPVGTSRPVKVDLRVVSATLQNLQSGELPFRTDLYARLAGVTFRIPPLRERIDDLGLLVADLLRALAPDRADRITIAPDVARRMLAHAWPRNVRELRQALQTALVLADDGVLSARCFPDLLAPGTEPEARASLSPSAPPPPEGASAATSDEDERLRILVITRLQEHRGNVTAVARAMNKAPMQIHRWMRRFAIDPNAFRSR